jgi:hypothetical protein
MCHPEPTSLDGAKLTILGHDSMTMVNNHESGWGPLSSP